MCQWFNPHIISFGIPWMSFIRNHIWTFVSLFSSPNGYQSIQSAMRPSYSLNWIFFFCGCCLPKYLTDVCLCFSSWLLPSTEHLKYKKGNMSTSQPATVTVEVADIEIDKKNEKNLTLLGRSFFVFALSNWLSM